MTLIELCNKKYGSISNFSKANACSMLFAVKLLQGRYKSSMFDEQKYYMAELLKVSRAEFDAAEQESYTELLKPYYECEKTLLRTVEEEWDKKVKKWKELSIFVNVQYICIVCEHYYYSYEELRYGEGRNQFSIKTPCGHGWEHIFELDPEQEQQDTLDDWFGLIIAIIDRKKRMQEKIMNQQYVVTLTGEVAHELNTLLFVNPIKISAEEYIKDLIHHAWEEMDNKIENDLSKM